MKTRLIVTWIVILSSTLFATDNVMGLTVSSPAVEEGGTLPAEFTGDGDGSSIPVEWSDVPASTQSFALSLWHVAPDQEKSYWIVYNIPADVRALPQNVSGIGTVGFNDHDEAAYMPMNSQGPGVKEYHLTVFALSIEPQFATDVVTRAVLLDAITDITLAEGTLTFTYERSQTDEGGENPSEESNGGSVIAPGATLEQIGTGYEFAEGPAVDANGNIYFTDQETSTIYVWSIDGAISTYLTDSGGANGLMFDADGTLVMCQGELGRVASRDAEGRVTVLADQYNGIAFNKPNDLWIAPNGGIYFSDPAYGAAAVQDGEHVYYITPDRSSVIRVIDDMVRPNGIIGRSDGSKLYVTDHGAGQTYVYEINADGALFAKTLFAAIGGDGMTIDRRDNVYLAATDGIVVFNPEGNQKEMIEVPEEPTNVCLGGIDGQTLLITARSTLYAIRISIDDADRGNGDGNQGDNSNMSVSQAISDEAQMKTIAFTGLAFLTGDLCSDSFFPPGKVSDFFGFQYHRDITPNGFGHNTVFAGNIADNVLEILTDDQAQLLVALANEQIDQVNEYAYQRFVLMKAFRRLIENDLPTGTSGLDMDAVMAFSADLYEIDAEISYDRAVVLGGIVTELTDAQKTALVNLEAELNALFEQSTWGGTIDEADWPHPSTRPDLSGLTNNRGGRVLVSTLATQLFSWYLGSVEGDTYFCPERHGTYFGSFYMKDVPPISASEPITIDTNLTANMGQAFLDALDDDQAQLITDLLDLQRPALNSIVATRTVIAGTLRQFMEGIAVDKDEVIALIREYGAYDGELICNYATNFVSVAHSLTLDQEVAVMGIRLGYYELFPDHQVNPNVYDCVGAWLYSSPLGEMPEIEDTDSLFE